ncbi:SANT/Myb-like DNA-binding domain-containing protein [Bradyrhizobium sp. USDA 4452]
MPVRSWSAEEEQQLLQLIRETGLTQREIAHKMGRTEAAVSARLTIIRKRVVEHNT